jgi:allophanate hydrolase
LNGDLTSRGATFVRKASTGTDYKLYALPGGPPFRPGLVRIAPGQGKEIALELWAIPLGAFGSFMQTIPSPLGIGTVQLSDGGKVFGFICESQAVKDALDITDLADWRQFLQRSKIEH